MGDPCGARSRAARAVGVTGPPDSILRSVWGKTQSQSLSVREVMTAPWWHVPSLSSQAKGELTATQDGIRDIKMETIVLEDCLHKCSYCCCSRGVKPVGLSESKFSQCWQSGRGCREGRGELHLPSLKGDTPWTQRLLPGKRDPSFVVLNSQKEPGEKAAREGQGPWPEGNCVARLSLYSSERNAQAIPSSQLNCIQFLSQSLSQSGINLN